MLEKKSKCMLKSRPGQTEMTTRRNVHPIGHADMLLFSCLYGCISCLCFNQLVTATWQSWMKQTDDRESTELVHA